MLHMNVIVKKALNFKLESKNLQPYLLSLLLFFTLPELFANKSILPLAISAAVLIIMCSLRASKAKMLIELAVAIIPFLIIDSADDYYEFYYHAGLKIIAGLLLCKLLIKNTANFDISEKIYRISSLMLIIVGGCYFLVYSLGKYFNTQMGVDLAIFSQLTHNIFYNQTDYISIYGLHHLSKIHFSPIFLPLSILAAPFNAPIFLLSLQAICIPAAIYFSYKLVNLYHLNNLSKLLILIIILMQPGIWGVYRYEFHEIAFFFPLVIAYVYFVKTDNTLHSFITLALCLMIKEDVSLYMLPLCLAFYIQHRKKSLLISAGVCLAYYIIVSKFIIQSDYSSRFLDPNGDGVSSFSELIVTALKNPKYFYFELINNQQKFKYLFYSLLSVAFLPLTNLRALIAASFGIILPLLSSYYQQFAFGQHYSIIPCSIFVASSLAFGLSNKLFSKPNYSRNILIAMCLLSISMGLTYGDYKLAIAKERLFQLFAGNNRDALATHLKITENNPLAASVDLLPSFYDRQNIYLFGRNPLPEGIDIAVDLNGDLWPSTGLQEIHYKLSHDYFIKTGYKSFLYLKQGAPEYPKDFAQDKQRKSALQLGAFRQNSKFSFDPLSSSKAVISTDKKGQPSLLVFGPYEKFSAGHYKFIARLKVDDIPESAPPDTPIFALDVYNHPIFIKNRMFMKKDLKSTGNYEDYSLEVVLEKDFEKLEYRVQQYGNAILYFDTWQVTSQ